MTRKIFTNIKEMFDDIKGFVKENDISHIVQDDNPYQLTIGYRDNISEASWGIRISAIRNSYKELPEKGMNFSTEEGKQEILDYLNEKEDESE